VQLDNRENRLIAKIVVQIIPETSFRPRTSCRQNTLLSIGEEYLAAGENDDEF